MICMTFVDMDKPRQNLQHCNFLKGQALAVSMHVLARVTLLPFDTRILNIEDQ